MSEKECGAKLNIGCGSRYRSDWTNIDIMPVSGGVLKHDIRKPLPFDACVFDFLYHSHVLEHCKSDVGVQLLRECRRILRPGGILRVVVPDLENIAREYIACIERCDAGNLSAIDDLEWVTLELFDQVSRESTGGRMAAYLKRPGLANKSFVLKRWGSEARAIINASRIETPLPMSKSGGRSRSFAQRFRIKAKQEFRWSTWRERAVKCLLGAEYDDLQIARFRCAGEVHMCMYDRVALRRALEAAGFGKVQQRSATTSYWSEWMGQCLDADVVGVPYKPDSLYMEAVRPD